MTPHHDLRKLVPQFLAEYDAAGMDLTWADLSATFRHFWSERVMAPDGDPISDDDCDAVIRMLDRNAKGNTKTSQSVARAMVPQGAWRRILNRLHLDRQLGNALNSVFIETEQERRAAAIDELYRLNEGERNYLTGGSGNAVCAFLAAHDPIKNLSVISLKDRAALLEFLAVPLPVDMSKDSVGVQITRTGDAILRAARDIGLDGSARTISRFFYWPPVKSLWKGEHTVQVSGHSVSMAVPTDEDEKLRAERDAAVPEVAVSAHTSMRSPAGPVVVEGSPADEIRESMQIQALVAKIGALMGFSIWLPRSDRSRVLKAWTPKPGELLDVLPLGYDAITTKTIEQIDVLWLRRRSIARAFEVEHTTSIYSGLLRMADLVALQPDINVKLHIVASVERQDKVLEEIKRPVFAMLDPRPLREMCTYLSYDRIREVAELKHLSRLPDSVLEEYEIRVEADDEL